MENLPKFTLVCNGENQAIPVLNGKNIGHRMTEMVLTFERGKWFLTGKTTIEVDLVPIEENVDTVEFSERVKDAMQRELQSERDCRKVKIAEDETVTIDMKDVKNAINDNFLNEIGKRFRRGGL